MSPSPGPGPRFPGPGLRDPGDPVPDADPWFARPYYLTYFINKKLEIVRPRIL